MICEFHFFLALKHILWYLKGIITHGLHIGSSSVDCLVSYLMLIGSVILLLVGPTLVFASILVINSSPGPPNVKMSSFVEAEYQGWIMWLLKLHGLEIFFSSYIALCRVPLLSFVIKSVPCI